VNQPVSFVADGGVHFVAVDAVALVDVPEHGEAGSDPRHRREEIGAAHILAVHGAVRDPFRRAVRDQHVDAPGNEGPLRGDLRAALQVEGPVEEPGLPGRAPEAQAPEGDVRVAEVVDACGQERSREFRLPLEQEVVVPRHHDLVRVGLEAQPHAKGRDLGGGSAHGEIARVDEDVARGQDQGLLLIVRIRNQDQPHRTLV